jgi:putative Holliday junction resolvase
MSRLKPYLDQHQPVGVVIGLPLTAEGREGTGAADARAIGALVTAKTALPVGYWDERMTTARVLASIHEAGGRAGKAGSGPDALAATVLLQTFLDHRRC